MLLTFDHVTYTYPNSSHPALQDLTLHIPPAKRCALIGRNGCGKTTLFLLANGLYRPQQGVISWQDLPLRYDRAALTQLRQNVGLVFQDPEHQLVAATVEEDLSYGLCNLGLPDQEVRQRVAAAIAQFNLADLAARPVHHLSLGEKKRVSLADVMILQPQLLLLDEPTAYLDPSQTRDLITNLQHIQATGTTIVMATHDLDLAYRWAEWVFILDQGQLVLEGTPQDVFAQREILESLHLGVPLIFEVLDQVVERLTNQAPTHMSELPSSSHPAINPAIAPLPASLRNQILNHFRYKS
ncbi:MAG: ATP-binding cassette domain-containing protein [Leptolyngbyaceae cyanobacterium bins.349]|nr:ATP-binding cassette domain-containing protein [Leptolyngbyaceae cyanobacterium bins.349]